MRVLKHLAICVLIATASFGVAGCMSASEPLPGSLIGPPSLSPDGTLVAFSYGKRASENWLVLYDTVSKSLRLVEKPPHIVVSAPSFSPDGRKLAVATYCYDNCTPSEFGYQIAIINLANDELRFVTSGRDLIRLGPVFSADGRTVFFVSKTLAWRDAWVAEGKPWDDDWGESQPFGFTGASKLDLQTGVEKPIFPNSGVATSFLGIFLGSTTEENDLVFTAIAPQDGEVESIVERMDKETALLGYVYNPIHGLTLLPENNVTSSMNSLSASADGRRKIFISSSPDYQFDYELYQSVDGRVSQLTSLKTHMYAARISGNDGKIVFLADNTRQKNWSVWIHDLLTNETRIIMTPDALLAFLGS
ncbi:MAG: hypothetical protein RLO08_06560 [Parvibaculaceae bacterium]